jgi:hypothetical protein
MEEQDQFEVNLDRNQRKKLNFGKVCQQFICGKECEECAKSDSFYRLSKSAENQTEKDAFLNQARTLYAKSKIFINAINVKDEDRTFPVRVYAIPPSVYDDLMGQIRGLRQLDPTANIFHPITGRAILVTKKGSSIQTRYTVQIHNAPSPIPNIEVLEKLKSGDTTCLPNLDDIEEFIHQNYLHITQFENNGNVIRLLPSYNGHAIYKELKFHRFTVGSLRKMEQNESVPKTEDTNSGTFNIKVKDEFNPFDLQNVEQNFDVATDTSDIDTILNDVKNIGAQKDDDIPF